jgi:membrane protein DedA with SNARE-associated domain
MTEFLQFLIDHGYTVIFVWVALDQAGLPLPAIPLLLAAGALVGMGELSLPLVLVTCALASVPIDAFWFWLGRKRGARVLHLLCIISLEPDYCVRDTERLFRRLGPWSVIIAKFVPGLQTLAPPMSGLTGMRLSTFLILDTVGILIWAAVFALTGMFFHTELEMMAARVAEAGMLAGIAIVAALGVFFGWKFVNRRIFLRSLRMRRMTPEEVYGKLQSDDEFHIIDLRHDYDFKAMPHLLPGALRVPMESIDLHGENIPPDSDIVLYCS